MSKIRLLASSALVLVSVAAMSAQTAVAQTGESTAHEGASVVHPLWGDIRPFDGEVSPFWGDIRPFWGDIRPFWGDIRPFWGDIRPFWGDIRPFWGDIRPFWGDIRPFWEEASPLMGELEASWGDIRPFGEDETGYGDVRTDFLELVATSEEFWGTIIEEETGKSFWDGFAADVFAKYNIDLDDVSTFDGFDAGDRAEFLFAWHDGLMGFTGLDQVDHWMKTANWTPALTQELGSGEETMIGLIDFAITGDADIQDNRGFIAWGGNDDPMSGHGGAVAGLLVADHDGKGVMGIAPMATVAAFSPFDESGTASWQMIAAGVQQVSLAGANVVNMSLGVPGTTLDQGWNNIYSRMDIALLSSNTIFVHAAGNDGLAQTQDIEWNFLTDPNMLIVGSVGPSGRISSFSNTPGTACLLDKSECKPGNRLMDRFLVAPGEWILVTDGEGGVRRASGTSFAAPIVTGAIALMQDRWGWLKSNPEDVIEIILKTATDLGEEGVDEVYGHGLINIAASQSPLDYKKLYQRGQDADGNPTKNYLASLDTSGKVETLLGATDGYITAFEDVGDTYRDFLIPLDEFLTETVQSATGELEQLQTFLSDDFASWSLSVGGIGISSKNMKKKGGLFLGGQQIENPMGWDLKLVSLDAMPLTQRGSGSEAPYATSLSITSQSNVTFNFGNGMGAKALNGQDLIGSGSFDPVLGGGNPVLGLASGGGFASVDVPVFGDATLSFGATERSYEGVYNDPFSGEELRLNQSVIPYRSAAANVLLRQPVGENLSLSAGYTFLQERDGVLGVQSTNPTAFSDGARTDALSVGMEWGISQRISLSGTATLGRTRGQSSDVQMLAVNTDGITTSAFEVAIDLDGVFGKSDAARFALVQPMHVEVGGLDMTSVEVVDRTTGGLSTVTRFTPVDDQAREMALEAFYAVPVLKGRAQVAGFVRAELATADGVQEQANHMIGGSFSLGF